MINKRGPKPGTPRGNRQRFPYEPRVVRGKLLMPAELQAIHRYVTRLSDVDAKYQALYRDLRGEMFARNAALRKELTERIVQSAK